MDRREIYVVAVAVAAATIGVWLLSFGGSAHVKTQLDVAASSADDGPLADTPLSTGVCPDRWRPHVPAGAHLGRHRMYRHPKTCSPNLTAPQQVAYDWLYSPPAQGDL